MFDAMRTSNSARKIMIEQIIVTCCKPAPANILRVNQDQRGVQAPIPWYVSSHTTINLTLSVGEETNVCRLVNISNSIFKIMMEKIIVTGCKPAPANTLRVHQDQRGKKLCALCGKKISLFRLRSNLVNRKVRNGITRKEPSLFDLLGSALVERMIMEVL